MMSQVHRVRAQPSAGAGLGCGALTCRRAARSSRRTPRACARKASSCGGPSPVQPCGPSEAAPQHAARAAAAAAATTLAAALVAAGLAAAAWGAAPAPQLPPPVPLLAPAPAAARLAHAHAAAPAPTLLAAAARNEVAATADDVTDLMPHWLVTLLAIAALNVAGLWGVQQLVRAAMDTSTPVTLVKLRCALRETQHGGGLRRRLGEMKGLAGAGQEGLWLTLEEAVSEINRRHSNVAYAEATAMHFRSRNAALDAFRRVATEEAALADEEEASRVSPAPPDECGVDWEKAPHPLASRLPGPLQSLLGVDRPTDSSCDEMVVVTLVVTARGVLDVPPVTNWPSLRHALQQICGVSRTSLMAIELLWAPDDAGDFLSAADVIADYPDLIDLSTGRPVGQAAAQRGGTDAGAGAPQTAAGAMG